MSTELAPKSTESKKSVRRSSARGSNIPSRQPQAEEKTIVSDIPAEPVRIELDGNSSQEVQKPAGSESGTNPTPSSPTTNPGVTPQALIELARQEGAEFFQDQHGSVFAWIPTGGEDEKEKHFECLGIQSRVFRARLLQLVKAKTGALPQSAVLKQAIEIMEIEAYGRPGIELDNRRKTSGDETCIDLGDADWRMVWVTPQGWEVKPHEQPRFFRPLHMRSLPEPVKGGNPYDLFNYVPLDTQEEKLLVMAWTVAALYSSVPNPILLFVGQQGSAKTTRSRRLRSLLDPSITAVLGDLEMTNLFLTFQQHAIPCFENVSKFSRSTADMFCRAVTGNGVERRKLYTNSDQVLYSFRRSSIINGIDTPSTRPDFLDRCLVINCRRMEKFTTLQELDEEFEQARPKLFGAILDLLVQTLAVYGATKAATEFRMADFARFGRAVAVALGKKPHEFDDAYRLNIEQQNSDVLEDSPMTRLVKKFAARYPAPKKWTGTAEQLLAQLHQEAHITGDTTARNDLPRTARWLSSRLSELAPALALEGAIVTKLPRTNASRNWAVSSTAPVDPNAEPDLFQVHEEMEEELKNEKSHAI
jgi:hypothetical protein